MNTLIKLSFLTTVFLLATAFTSIAQIKKSDWVVGQEKRASTEIAPFFEQLPSTYREANIVINVFQSTLKLQKQEIQLPDPSGKFITYIIQPSQIVADEVAHLYTIKTFKGFQKDNPGVRMSCDISDHGFRASIYKSDETFFIEPLDFASAKHLIFYKENIISEGVRCHVPDDAEMIGERSQSSFAPNTKRTLRLAIVAMGEYSQQFGGSPYNSTNVLNALASGVNSIAPIFLRDLGVEFNLVTTAALIFPDPNTDPFDINNQGSLLTDCHSECVAALGVNGFDVGHIVAWAFTGGLASLGVICNNNSKGRGFSGNAASLTTLWVDYVAHELGHQFSSNHNFRASCSGNSANSYRYEPGEGSSIMCYAGVCGANNSYKSNSDPFFHYASINQIQNHLNSTNCAQTNNAGNSSDPVANAQNNITIPKQTPFILVGSASDANDPSSALTYNWEQYNGTGGAIDNSPDCSIATASLFRYRVPVSVDYRHFPTYGSVLGGNNNGVAWEKLPCTARSMNFSMAIRDNNSSFGRVVNDLMIVTVANTGPFDVSIPNGGETLAGSTTITWTVNGTDAHCANVDILLSIDGGATYTVMADAVPNDGSENITLPNITSTTARILVRCDVQGGFRAASTFFDVSNANFNINPVPACQLIFTVTDNPVPSGLYKAIDTVISNTSTSNGSNVTYTAEQQICLDPGFEVPVGAVFEAKIEVCN